MLKFSGFSDLTSCLCLNALAAVEAAPFAQTDHNAKSAIKCHRVELDTLHASRAQVRRGAQKLTTAEAGCE